MQLSSESEFTARWSRRNVRFGLTEGTEGRETGRKDLMVTTTGTATHAEGARHSNEADSCAYLSCIPRASDMTGGMLLQVEEKLMTYLGYFIVLRSAALRYLPG